MSSRPNNQSKAGIITVSILVVLLLGIGVWALNNIEAPQASEQSSNQQHEHHDHSHDDHDYNH